MVEPYDSTTSKTHRRDPAPWILNSHARLLRALRHGLSPVLSPFSRSNRGRRDQGLPPAPVGIKKLAVSSIIVAVSALRFFFGQVLHRPTKAIEQALPRMKKPVLRPKLYSVQQLERLFGCPGLNRKHRALFMTTYAAGLRVSEV